MNWTRKLKIYFFPIFFLILPALLGLGYEAYNRYFRSVSTPFLFPSIGLLLLSLFFWARRRWLYFILISATAIFLIVYFRYLIIRTPTPPSIVHYYLNWTIDTKTGHIKLADPMKNAPPASGAYVSCNFSLKSWRDYFSFQPILCTAFDDQLRLKMTLNDHDTIQGPLREIQINNFRPDRKSLLGEPIDRSALRLAFTPLTRGKNEYKIKAIYQVYEREISPGRIKIVESFSRDSRGNLKSFTESPLIKFSKNDVYALYDAEGELVEIPNMKKRTFSFPANINVGRYKTFHLPRYLGPEA